LRNISSGSTVIICLMLFVFISVLPLSSYAVESIYTIQAGSFKNLSPARRQFNSIIQGLNEKELDSLRIEKIGKYYSVRLGKFKDKTSSKRLLSAIKPHVPEAVVMKAYFKKERIVELYKGSLTTGEQKVQDKPLSTTGPDKIKPLVTKKAFKSAGKKRKPGSLDDRIKIISNLVDKKDYKRALEEIRADIAVWRESHELNGWYGAVLLKMKRPSEAIKYFQKAIKLSPGVSDYHNGGGYCLSFLNRFNEAIDEFNKAVALDPANIDAFTGLGIAYVKTGKKNKAMDIYNKLKELDRDSAGRLLQMIKETTASN